MNVATRWSPVTPSASSPWASCAARAPSSAKVSRRAPSPSQVVTVAVPWTVEPCSSRRLMARGTSCMVDRTAPILHPVRLEGTRSGEDDPDGPYEDDEVERRRPALDVVQVELHAFLPARLLAAGDLPEAGQPGLGQVAPLVHVVEQVCLFEQHRPRTDHRHRAGEDVDELRKLVERPAPQETSHGGDPGIVAVALRHVGVGSAENLLTHEVGTVDHRAELHEAERTT